MKKVICLSAILFLLLQNSCSKKTDCYTERAEVYEFFQNLIELARNNEQEVERLKEARDIRLLELGCYWNYVNV